MRSLTARTFLAAAFAKHARAFAPASASAVAKLSNSVYVANSASAAQSTTSISTRRYMSARESVTQVGKEAFNEILEDIENSSREESGYVIIDVRNRDEIAGTGKLADVVETLPLPLIAQMGAFSMEEDDFEEAFGFAKPALDETLVFTCKAGIRSMQAAQLASMAGYTNLVNYTGGSMDWFR
jgi:rhodanese-related sulfurtransferase